MKTILSRGQHYSCPQVVRVLGASVVQPVESAPPTTLTTHNSNEQLIPPLPPATAIVSYQHTYNTYTNATMKLSCTIALTLAVTATTNAFIAPPSSTVVSRTQQCQNYILMSESESTESAFVADVAPPAEEGDKAFDAVEMMGKGAAKVRFP